MSQVVAGISVDLQANIAQFMSNMDKAAKKTSSTFDLIKKGAGALAGAFAFGEVTAAVQRVLDFAGRIQDASNRLGIGVEALQRWEFAAGQVGIQAAELESGLGKFVETTALLEAGLGRAGPKLDALAPGLRNAISAAQGTEAQLAVVAARLGQIEDPARRAAVASLLFGDAMGPKLAAAAAQGQGALQALLDDASVMSEGQIAAADAAGDAIDRMLNRWSTAGGAFVGEIAPALEMLANLTADYVVPAVNFLGQVFTRVAETTGKEVKLIIGFINELLIIDKIGALWYEQARKWFIDGFLAIARKINEIVNSIITQYNRIASVIGAEITAPQIDTSGLEENARLQGELINDMKVATQKAYDEVAGTTKSKIGFGSAAGIDGQIAQQLEQEAAAVKGGAAKIAGEHAKGGKKIKDESKSIATAIKNDQAEITRAWDDHVKAQQALEEESIRSWDRIGNSVMRFAETGEFSLSSFANLAADIFSQLAGDAGSLGGILQSVFGNIGSGGGKGGGGDLFGMLTGGGFMTGGGGGDILGGIGDLFGGFFADGGRPPVGVPSVVGERGPELFIPDHSGTIVPNGALGGGGGPINLTINVDARNSVATQAIVEQAAAEGARRGVAEVKRRSAVSPSFAQAVRGKT